MSVHRETEFRYVTYIIDFYTVSYYIAILIFLARQACYIITCVPRY